MDPAGCEKAPSVLLFGCVAARFWLCFFRCGGDVVLEKGHRLFEDPRELWAAAEVVVDDCFF